LVSISFGVYHSILGVSSWRSYDNVYILTISIAIFLGSLVLSVVASPGLVIGRLPGFFVALGGVFTVVVAHLGLNPGHTEPYSTWYVGGMSVLFGVLAARGQSIQAWLAAAVVVWLVFLEDGLSGLGEVGIEGLAILIAAASATAFALKRADVEVRELQAAELASETAIVSSRAASDERRSRLQKVMEQALPSLSFIAANKGNISSEYKSALIQLEASLRDDIRGRFLMNDVVREAAAQARARGVEVLILDEGGLSGVSDNELEIILSKVVSALNSVTAGKVVVRSPRGEKWLVTVMATRPGTQAPDLWLKF